MNDLNFRPNTLYHGDCLTVMEGWARAGKQVDLIYLDPPFNSNANYNILFGKDQTGKPRDEQAQFLAFHDTWYWGSEVNERIKEIKRAQQHRARQAIHGLNEIIPETGMLAYLVYMADRLNAMHPLLKDTGSIYLHCDPTASHYLKMVMDEVFGRKNFRNEIIWRIGWLSGFKTQKKGWIRNHDTILYYLKSKQASQNFNKEYIPYSANYVRRDGKKPTGKGVPIEDTWNCSGSDVLDSIMIKSFSREKLGYPTQKPLALLERIIKASSNEGDVVLDPFCGCGTTAEAAYNLGRQFLGIDIAPYAIKRVCGERLKDAKGVEVRGLPTDLESAAEFAAANRFAFEQWAITNLAGFAPNEKQTGDGGIDGRGHLLIAPLDQAGQPESDLCIAQVKSGGVSVDSIRAFASQLIGGRARLGVFITLNKTKQTPTMREAIAHAGAFKLPSGIELFNRLMFWSIEECFAGIYLKLPPMTDPGTGKAMHPDRVPMDTIARGVVPVD